MIDIYKEGESSDDCAHRWSSRCLVAEGRITELEGRHQVAPIAVASGLDADATLDELYEHLGKVRNRIARAKSVKPKRMSFATMTGPFLDGSKTVTRRPGWNNLAIGDELIAVEKSWLKKGEHQVEIGRLVVTDVRREPLSDMTDAECVLEGCPEMDRQGFIEMFCRGMHCEPSTEVARIEFRKLPDQGTKVVL